jgi:hypothetical protein
MDTADELRIQNNKQSAHAICRISKVYIKRRTLSIWTDASLNILYSWYVNGFLETVYDAHEQVVLIRKTSYPDIMDRPAELRLPSPAWNK